jgi:hypothetical protein
VAISMCDGTRAQPRHLMIPAVLEIDGVVDRNDVVILVDPPSESDDAGAERAQPPREPGELSRRRSVPARPDAGNARGADARRLRIGLQDSCRLRNGLGV